MKGGNRNNVASSSNQRARISRRTGPQQQQQQQQPPTQQQKAAEERKPLIAPKGRNPVPGGIVKFLSPQAAPRSGQFILPTITTLTANSPDDKGKPRVQQYRVNLPWRMLAILSLVFLAMPLTIFTYKEVKIKEDHENVHEKPHQLQPAANAHDLLSQMANQTIPIPPIGSEPMLVQSQATNNTTTSGDKTSSGDSEKKSSDQVESMSLESEKVVISEATTKTNQTVSSTNQTRLRRL